MSERQLKPALLLTIAAAFLVVHSALNTIFPAAAQPISYIAYMLVSVAALAVCVRRAFCCLPEARRNWILLSGGMLSWSIASILAARAEFILHTSSQAAALDDFFYFFYGVPILLSIVSSDESRLRPVFFWLDAIQASVAAYLAYIVIFAALPFTRAHAAPIGVDRLVWIYDTENLILSLFAAARLLATPRHAPERRFFVILNSFLWSYLLCAGAYNHVVAAWTDARGFDSLVELPFLGLACASALSPVPRPAGGAERLKPAAMFIDNVRPVALGFAILALSAIIARDHFAVGMSAAFCAFALYGIRCAMLQSRFLETQVALEEAMQRLAELALQDGLTGIANRRCFDQRFEMEWSRLHRSQQPLSLLLIDIDHFKALNDNHGHQAGDECLVQVADLLRRTMQRPGDLLARYGGEEFVALLPETDADGAWRVAMQMKALVGGSEPGLCVRIPLTISIGIASLVPPRAGRPSLLLEAADRALYTAKQNGRDRIEILPRPTRSPA